MGWLHQRPLNRHTGGRRMSSLETSMGRGHSASIATEMAAASSSVAAGEIEASTPSR
jgi:hypothetical protein